MTEKENLQLLFTPGAMPKWVPHMFRCYNFIVPTDSVADRPPFGVQEGTDWFGCHWVWDAPTDGFTPDPRYPVPCTDITKWREQVTFPDLELVDWEGLVAPVRAGYDPERMTQVMLQCGVFERLHALLGFEEAFIAMYEEPEAVHELMEAITEHRVAVIHKVVEHFKPDVITNMDDYGHAHGPFLSKEMFREFILPYAKRVVDAVKEHGVIYMHHSCGTISSMMEELLEMGIDALTALAPTNDIEMMIRDYSDKIVFDGGMDNVGVLSRIDVTEEEVRAEARRAIDLFAPQGNYVAGGYCPRVWEDIVQDETLRYGKCFYEK